MDFAEIVALIDTAGMIGVLLWTLRLARHDAEVANKRHDADTAYYRAELRRLCREPERNDIIQGSDFND